MKLMPGGEPFFLPAGSVGCLLVHGFTATPQEVRWMGEYLQQQGYTCLGVRLHGHATAPEDLARTTWQDWLASVEDGYAMLESYCDHVVPAGLSLGGALCLLLASARPVPALISMATPYQLSNLPHPAVLRTLKLVKKFLRKGPPSWHDPEALHTRVQYDVYPIAAILQILDLLETLRPRLGSISAPALLMHSRADGFVRPESCQSIHDALASTNKQIKWVEKSSHVISCDSERKQVFEHAAHFLQRIFPNTD